MNEISVSKKIVVNNIHAPHEELAARLRYVFRMNVMMCELLLEI